jgi:hypothetical protein
MANDKIKISSCFMHFDGVKEPLSKISQQRLKKIVQCRPKWAKFHCEVYNLFEDSSVNSYSVKDDENFDIEWYHHMKFYKKFCDEEKIRRQEKRGKMYKHDKHCSTTQRKATNGTHGTKKKSNSEFLCPIQQGFASKKQACIARVLHYLWKRFLLVFEGQGMMYDVF